MAILIFVLTLFMAVANFSDFLIGREGDLRLRQAAQRLAHDSGGDWRVNLRTTTRHFYEFVSRILGRSTRTRVIRIIAVSVAVFCVLVVAAGSSMPGSLRWSERYFVSALAWPNLMGDAASWLITMHAVNQIANSAKSNPLGYIALATGVALLSIVLTYSIVILEVVALAGHLNEFGDIAILVWKSMLHVLTGKDPHEFGDPGFLSVVPLFVVWPLVLYILVIALGALLHGLRIVARRPISFVVRRLEQSKRPVLTMAAGGIAGVVALVAAWSNVGR